MVLLCHLLRKGNQFYLYFCEELISFLSRANVHAFHESPDRIYTDLTCINPLSPYHKKLYVFVVCWNITNSVDPDQTAPVGAVWSGSTLFASMFLLNKKTDTFECSYFAGVLKFKSLLSLLGCYVQWYSYFRIKPHLILSFTNALNKPVLITHSWGAAFTVTKKFNDMPMLNIEDFETFTSRYTSFLSSCVYNDLYLGLCYFRRN